MRLSNCKISQSLDFSFSTASWKEEIINPYKNNKLEKINRMKHGIVLDTLTSVDSAEINK